MFHVKGDLATYGLGSYSYTYGDVPRPFVHGIVCKALMGWAPILTLMAMFLVARESFARWSSGSSPVRGIIYLLGGQLRIR